MIKEIQIQNFKCFTNYKPFEFSKINLLTGINGRGKSSLLQAFLILSQSAWKNKNLKKLVINDELINLGNFDDIKNSETPRGENIHFNIKFDLPFIDEAKIQYNENPDEPLLADFVKLDITSQGKNYVINNYDKEINQIVLTFSEILKAFDFVTPGSLLIAAISLAILILWDNLLTKKQKI